MSRLCIIFSHASLYREPIYRLIDKAYDCEWHFSDEDAGVARFDIKVFRNVFLHRHHKLNRFHWISGINRLLCKKKNTTFLMHGGTVDLSCWLFFLRAHLFYPHKKVYVWAHGWYGKETKIEAFIKRILWKSVSGIFVYGDYAKGLMIKEGIPADRIFVLHNSLDYDVQLELRKSIVTESSLYKNHFQNDNPNIIYIGRLIEVKKLDQLIDAIFISKSNGRFYNLTFVGDGPMKESLVSRVSEKGVEDNVWFYGASYDQKVNAELVYHADLCVAPGNIGLTAMHCMMFGTPVLSHNDFKWQMPEFEAIVPGETGDFFIRDSVIDISRKIDDWFDNHLIDRARVREKCYEVIDKEWNPYYQIEVIKRNLRFAERT